MKSLLSSLMCLLVLCVAVSVSAADFPLRSKYPNVIPISTDELAARYDQALIVDVRSSVEYDVIHVKKATNVSVSDINFLADLEKVRAKNGTAPLVAYCNGETCAKSYKACEQAGAAGFTNMYVYDAGIFAWAQAHPEKAVLLGDSPVPSAKLIPKSKLNAKSLAFVDFKKAADAGAMVIDVREPWQRAKNPELPQNRLLALNGVRNVPLERLVPLLEKGQFKNKQLLIADAVGKQVRWLQYHLEKHGYTDYAFLKGGAKAAAEAGGVK